MTRPPRRRRGESPPRSSRRSCPVARSSPVPAGRFSTGHRHPHISRSWSRGAVRFRRDGITASAPRASGSPEASPRRRPCPRPAHRTQDRPEAPERPPGRAPERILNLTRSPSASTTATVLPAGMSPARAHMLSAGTVPAAIGAGNGMETDGPQPECQQALTHEIQIGLVAPQRQQRALKGTSAVNRRKLPPMSTGSVTGHCLIAVLATRSEDAMNQVGTCACPKGGVTLATEGTGNVPVRNPRSEGAKMQLSKSVPVHPTHVQCA